VLEKSLIGKNEAAFKTKQIRVCVKFTPRPSRCQAKSWAKSLISRSKLVAVDRIELSTYGL
jgi:hypothetical protein